MDINELITKRKVELIKELEKHPLFKDFHFGGIYEADDEDKRIRFIYIQPSQKLCIVEWILIIPLTKKNKFKSPVSIIERTSVSSLKNITYVGDFAEIKREEDLGISILGNRRATINL